MNRFSLPKIIVPLFTLLLIILTLYSTYQIFPEFKKSVDSVLPWTKKEDESQSPFEDLSPPDDIIDIYVPERTQVVDMYYNFLVESEAYSRENNETSSYWQNWNWQTHLFWAYVSGVNVDQKTVDLRFGSPESFGNLTNIPVSCEPENTAYFSSISLLQDTKVDVFDYVEPEDILYSQCLNEECTRIGNYCIIIDRDLPGTP